MIDSTNRIFFSEICGVEENKRQVKFRKQLIWQWIKVYRFWDYLVFGNESLITSVEMIWTSEVALLILLFVKIWTYWWPIWKQLFEIVFENLPYLLFEKLTKSLWLSKFIISAVSFQQNYSVKIYRISKIKLNVRLIYVLT